MHTLNLQMSPLEIVKVVIFQEETGRNITDRLHSTCLMMVINVLKSS